MRKNQKGFTLVELIIAVAILAVVTLAVCGFIVVGSRSYTSANTDIMLQQEAQLALNQISDVIIDTTDSINYSGKTAVSSEMQMVLKDSEFSEEPTEKCLAVVNKNDTTSNNQNPSYWFYWSKDDETIYFNEVHVDSSMPESEIKEEFNNAATDKAILAQHVKELHIDISQFEENRVVMISMTFQNGNKEYTTSNNVTVRNRVALNKIDIEPMKKAREFDSIRVTEVILEPNDTYSFPWTEDFKWEMVGEPQNETSITEKGELTIGENETRANFFVRAVLENKENDDQNEQVDKTVKVSIKRVNSVYLGDDQYVSPGSTVTVNCSMGGFLLGVKCNGNGCDGDDLSQDRKVAWSIVPEETTIGVTDDVIDKEGSDKAEIKIPSTAKADDKITIEARAILPDNKGYGPVSGKCTLKVKNEDKDLISGFRFGTDDVPGPLKEMYSNLGTEGSRYVACVRIRELNSPDARNDKIVMYYTNVGMDVRFLPDILGLDLTRSYNIFFQILNPISIESKTNKNYVEDDEKLIVQEYLDPNNTDPITGEYIGKKYETGPFVPGRLTPPSIKIKYNNVTYPNDDKDYYETFNFITSGNDVMGLPTLDEAVNINWNEILNNVKYSVYKGEGDDPAGWKKICVFDGTTFDYVGPKKTPGGSIEVHPGESTFLKTNSDAGNQRALDVGTYHIVPGFTYRNNPHWNGRNYYFLYPKPSPEGDFDTHYYEQLDCAITLKVDTGFNLHLRTVGEEKRWTNFPLPSDRAFPFDRKSQTKQEISYNFKEYSKDGVYRDNLSDVKVTCEYKGQNVYLITLSSIEIKGREVTTHIYGKFENKKDPDTGMEIWDRIDFEDTKKETIEPNLTFKRDNKEYGAYFPTPNDADFPANAFDDGSTINNWQLISFSTSGDDSQIFKCIVKCSSSKPHEMTITAEEYQHYHYDSSGQYVAYLHWKTVYNYGTFSWDGGKWNRTEDGSNSGEDTPVWGTCVEFSINNNQYKMEVPLPSEEGFPSFSGSYSDLSNTKYYTVSDRFGEYEQSGVGKIYSYDANTGIYTVQLVNPYYTPQIYGTWTCARNGTKWTRVD